MDGLCRLCGSSDGIRIRIFDPEADYVKRIHKILPISINEHDPFPKQMCHKCSFKVNEFFEFRTKCIEAQELFRRKIPWLKDKENSTNTTDRPMVEVHLSQLNSISPNEKQPTSNWSTPKNDPMIVIDDSPPYNEELLVSSSGDGNLAQPLAKPKPNVAKKKTSRKTIWDSKKRKRKSKKDSGLNFQIAEVFTTSMEEYQVIDSVEHDPLDITMKTEVSENRNNREPCSVENSSSTLNGTNGSPSDNCKPEPQGNDVTLPKNILVTRIPQVGLVYTCELCGRTFLSPAAGASHSCHLKDSSEDEKSGDQDGGTRPANGSPPDYYSCETCGQIFSRQSQLTFHKRNHIESSTSAVDSAIPTPKKRKYKKRTKTKKPRTPDLQNNVDDSLPNLSTVINEHDINRHSLLSSESD